MSFIRIIHCHCQSNMENFIAASCNRCNEDWLNLQSLVTIVLKDNGQLQYQFKTPNAKSIITIKQLVNDDDETDSIINKL